MAEEDLIYLFDILRKEYTKEEQELRNAYAIQFKIILDQISSIRHQKEAV